MIPTYADLRRALQEVALELGHPTKVDADGNPGKYGRVVYWEGGDVGVRTGERTYLIGHGDDHQESVWGLAHHLGLTKVDPGVEVEKVTAGHFWLRAASGE